MFSPDLPLNILASHLISIKHCKIKSAKNLRFAANEVNWGHITSFSWRSDCLFSLEMFVSFSIFKILFYIVAIIKKYFFVYEKAWHTFQWHQIYSSLTRLNEVWPCLHSRYFDKLPDIYQVNIVRFWVKIWVCTSWDELRSHYPVFPRALLFPPKIFW